MQQTLDKMEEINFEDFFNSTYSEIKLITCSNAQKGGTAACRQNWGTKINLYGNCLEYTPPEEVQQMDRK